MFKHLPKGYLCMSTLIKCIVVAFDIFSLLKDPSRNIIEVTFCSDPDTFGLHLNNAGYEQWFKALGPLITF